MKGTIVEYMEHGAFLTALVLEDDGRRLHIVNQKGREGNLPRSRCVHVGSRPVSANGRAEQLRILEETAARREALAADIDLASLWEVIEDGAETIEIALAAELYFGAEPDDDEMAAFLRRIFADRLYFKYKDDRLQVHSAEEVERRREQQRREAERKRLIEDGGRYLAAIWQGKEVADWPDRQRCLDAIAEYYLQGKEAPNRTLAVELLKAAGCHQPHGAFHLLVKAGYWDANENIALLREEIPTDFTDEVLAAAAACEVPATETLLAAGYQDLRHLPLVTIDGAETRDRDDAVHLRLLGDGRCELGIHITNVAACIAPNSVLFAEAERRVTSIYMADGQIPMLPPALSEDKLSLTAGVERPAISFLAELDSQGRLLGSRIVPSVVTVRHNYSYEDFDRLLAEGGELAGLHRLALQLQARRVERGAVILPFPDVIIDVEGGEPVRVRLADVDTPGRLAVAECMVLANILAAEYLATRALPGLFRSQGPPGQRIVRRPTKDLYTNFRQRRHLSPGQLSTEPLPHSSVGADQYTTVTSPIRRFLDLVMQHQLLHALLGKGVLFGEDVLRDWAGVIYRQQGRVNMVSQARHRYWLLRYLERHVGQRFPALVLGSGPRRVQFVLTDFLLDGDLPPNPAIGARPGDTVMVRIARVDALDGAVRFEW